MTDIKLIRAGSTDSDPVDLNNSARYEYSSNDSTPPHEVYARETKELRGQDGSQLVKSQLVASECSIRVYCLGADIAEAQDNESRIIERLKQAAAYSLPSRNGTKIEYVQSIRDQLAPQVWTVQYGEWRPVSEELKAANIIAGDIFLRMSPVPVADTPTLRTSPVMCNYDTWTFETLGSEPVDVKLSVEMLGAAAHYDTVRVGLLTAETVRPDHHIWPFFTGNVAAPTGYTVALENAGRLAGATVTIRAKGLGQYQLVYRSAAGTVYTIGAVRTCTDGAAYQSYVHQVTTDPATDLPFTVAAFNGGQFGIKKIGATSVRITQFILAPLYVPRDTLVEVPTNQLATGTGASDAWAKTGAGSAWDAVNDPVGADDGDGSYLSSATNGDVTLLTFPAYTAINALDTGVRGFVQGVGGFANGGMEAPYSGPSFGATLVNDPLSSLAGYSPRTDFTTSMVYNGSLSAIQVNPVPGRPVNSFGFAIGGYGGLTPGVAVRFQCDMRCSTGVPVGQGARVFIQDGSDRGYVLRANTSVFASKYIDFIPMSETISVFLMVEGTLASGLFKNILIREINSTATGWTRTGTMKAYQELSTSLAGLNGSNLAGYTYDGLSAQGIGPGDPTNALEQSFGVVDGETYRIVARLRDRGLAQRYGVDPTGVNLRVVSGANEEIYTSFSTFEFERVALDVVADGASMTVQAYANVDGAGVLDGVFVQRINAPTDFGAVAMRITLTQDLTDHYGTHQIWARMKVVGEPVAVSVRYGGDDGQLAGSGPVIVEPSTNVRIARIGSVVIPATPTAADAPIESFTFSIILAPGGSSDTITTVSFDAVELFPARQTMLAKNAEGKGAAPTQSQVFDGGSQTTYIANSSGSTLRTTAQMQGAYIRLFPGTNRLFVRVSRTDEDDRLCPEDTFRLHIKYTAAGHIKHVFNPLDLITKYEYWYRAYDLPGANGDNLDSWPDLSGHVRTGTWHGSGPHSTLVDAGLGSLRIVRLNGGRFHWPEIALANVQIFAIMKVSAQLFQGTLIRTSATVGPNYSIGINGAPRLITHMYSDNNNNATKKEATVLHPLPGGWHLYQLNANYVGGTQVLSEDGSSLGLGPNTDNLSGGSGVAPDGNTVTADIGQIIIAKDLTSDEVDALASFLLAEAGL